MGETPIPADGLIPKEKKWMLEQEDLVQRHWVQFPQAMYNLINIVLRK
jgi:hypothetical protein